MPLYKYHCQDCGEDFRKILDKPTEMQPCPNCGEVYGTKRQKVSRFSTRFKGRGFYQTDYKEDDSDEQGD